MTRTEVKNELRDHLSASLKLKFDWLLGLSPNSRAHYQDPSEVRAGFVNRTRIVDEEDNINDVLIFSPRLHAASNCFAGCRFRPAALGGDAIASSGKIPFPGIEL